MNLAAAEADRAAEARWDSVIAAEAGTGPAAEEVAVSASEADTTAVGEGRTGAVTEAGAKPFAGSGGGRVPEAVGHAGEQILTEPAEQGYYRPLWVEEPATRRRLPDPVRTSAVRAVIIIAVTLIQAMVAFLCTLAGSWLAFPMVLSSVASTVVATWGALDVWVTRQVWNQRHGVVSEPSSTARALRRERRKARRQERSAERTQERIRRRGGGTGQLSHS
ncbi:hypothetical protein [Streptomyces sp. NBC_00414]|uniref:hypothetical protein n=1 Tax=Streptomyces sp. NBC_00414 TaxID=2975739 RepID=UPI003FA706FA